MTFCQPIIFSKATGAVACALTRPPNLNCSGTNLSSDAPTHQKHTPLGKRGQTALAWPCSGRRWRASSRPVRRCVCESIYCVYVIVFEKGIKNETHEVQNLKTSLSFMMMISRMCVTLRSTQYLMSVQLKCFLKIPLSLV